MKTIIIAVFLGLAGQAQAQFYGFSAPADGKLKFGVAGTVEVSASSWTMLTPTIVLNGPNKRITVRNGAQVSTMTETGFYGSGAGLTALPAPQLVGKVPAGLVDFSTIAASIAGCARLDTSADQYFSGVLDAQNIHGINTGDQVNITGNAHTADSVASGGVDFSTITTALAGKVSYSGDTGAKNWTYGINVSSDVMVTGRVVAPRMSFNTPSVAISSEASAALGVGIRISTNSYTVGFSSAAKFYGDGSALTGIVSGGGGVSISTFSTDFHSGGDVFVASGSITANIGMAYVFENSTPTITAARCYTLYGSTVGATTFNFLIKAGAAGTANYLFSGNISVPSAAANATSFSDWVTVNTSYGAPGVVPAIVALQTTGIPASGTLPSEYGCVLKWWRNL